MFVHLRCTAPPDEQVGPDGPPQVKSNSPFGAVAGEVRTDPLIGGRPNRASPGGLFDPYAVPPQLLNFRVKKPENIVKFGGSTYEPKFFGSSENFSCDSQK